MSGALWGTLAGFGFGLFQSLNRRALQGMEVMASSFLQLLLSTVVLVAIAAVAEDEGALARAPTGSLVAFGLAGFVHFFLGWTLLNLSQKRIGAARTGPLLATTPLFATAIAAVTLAEVPTAVTLAGVAITVWGVLVLSGEGPAAVEGAGGEEEGALEVEPAAGRGEGRVAVLAGGRLALAPALGTALCWAVSPVFIRAGLRGLPSPLLGVALSMVVASAAYGLVVALRRRSLGLRRIPRGSLAFKAVAGLLVGLSTWARWIALGRAPVAVVLAVNSVSVPTVMLLAPVLMGRHLERVTLRLWAGAALVVGGSLILILWG